MLKVDILPEADKEFQEAAIWYEDRNAGLGLRFIDTIRKRLKIIEAHPERYPKRKNNFRESVIGIFPYVIVYKFLKKEERIVIHSIFHTSGNPNKKYKRRR